MSKPETTSDSDRIECPKCGKMIGDLWEYGSDEDMDIECGHCEAPLTLSRRVSIDYTATPR